MPTKGLGVGEVGYLITGVKDVRQSKVGDTVTNASKPAAEALGGYSDPKPMVFSGLYPIDGTDYPILRDALDKLKLNDAALELRARDVGRARVRVPRRLPRACCTSRSCASGSSASSTSTSSRPRRTSSTR